MAAALMSNLSSVLNSASTLVTIDFYKKFFRPDATERQQVRFGQISGTLILLLGIAIALYYSTQKDPLFVQVQRVFFFIAPPFAVIFTLGLLWRRANATARRHDGGARIPVLRLPDALCLPALGVPEAVQHLPAPRAGRVVLLHGRDDRHVARRPRRRLPRRPTGIIWSAALRRTCPRTSAPATRA